MDETLVAASTIEIVNVVALVVSPFVAALTALGIYWLSRRDAAQELLLRQRSLIVTQLETELAANARIIDRSLETIPVVLGMFPRNDDPNDPVYTEDLFLAPLFTASFEAVIANDLTRHLSDQTVDRLYDYYSTTARANWLIRRVQSTKYREPILREIEQTLRELRDPKRAVRIGLRADGSRAVASHGAPDSKHLSLKAK